MNNCCQGAGAVGGLHCVDKATHYQEFQLGHGAEPLVKPRLDAITQLQCSAAGRNRMVVGGKNPLRDQGEWDLGARLGM